MELSLSKILQHLFKQLGKFIILQQIRRFVKKKIRKSLVMVSIVYFVVDKMRYMASIVMK